MPARPRTVRSSVSASVSQSGPSIDDSASGSRPATRTLLVAHRSMPSGQAESGRASSPQLLGELEDESIGSTEVAHERKAVVPDRISREIVIDAPRNEVWAIVTDPRHVARWFSDEAEIDARVQAEYAGENAEGWNRELDELRDYVAHLGISYGSS
jgi:hypothetical protein